MNRIRELRESNGVSQADLYRRLGWRQSRLANYEAGNRTPGLNDARGIVNALNSLSVTCTLDEVFPDPSDRHPEEVPTLNANLRPNLAADQSAAGIKGQARRQWRGGIQSGRICSNNGEIEWLINECNGGAWIDEDGWRLRRSARI